MASLVAFWMPYAASLIGVREIKGPEHNPTILRWIKNLGRKIGIKVTDDETPWCGVYAGEVMQKAGFTPPDICVRASSWSKFGVELAEPTPGAILVFTRQGGGHVGFYVSEDADTYHVLGGNQSDAVNVTRIAKDRLSAVRWPAGVPLPTTGRLRKKFDGVISRNEA
jgi:uncharacterized protein (TIGR02594 family)